ncbi:MAG: hypothetical protein IKE53_09985 [Clostridiales bacterium]|nr:hypothetical protein [Clostridiales bacterium]
MGKIGSIYKEYLFDRHILVNDSDNAETDRAETLMALARLLNIRITDGADLVHRDMISFASGLLGEDVPEPFYRGFPQSVRDLTPGELFYDQLLNYYITYDLGDMSETRHSVLEGDIPRLAFREEGTVKDFSIVTAEKAMTMVSDIVNDLMCGSRPLNDKQFGLIAQYVRDTGFRPANVSSKNTAIRLLMDTRDLYFAGFIEMSDVIKLTEEMNFRLYNRTDIRKLNLKNQDRKFITGVINELIRQGRINTGDCYEKQKHWAGLLHHIHYKPVNDDAGRFAVLMRSGINHSAYTAFEREMNNMCIRNAVDILKEQKGSGAVLRNLNYIISRCGTEDNIRYVLDNIDSGNCLLLMQLYLQYLRYGNKKTSRSFSFAKFGMLKEYSENETDMKKRRSFLTSDKVDVLQDHVFSILRKNLAGRLGKVYIDPDMKRYALPIQESTAQSGFGVLPKGSRLRMDEFKKLRGFTYWEKVDDIDLTVIGIDEQGNQYEFSWRTMATSNSPAITYSGDETSGYNGGSEYYDIDVDIFRQEYPDVRYLVFCDNVYSSLTFDKCICRAGYMIRDREDSGEVFEPKTVSSSFAVNAKSRFCYLFAVDLMRNEFVWLNCARSSNLNVAGESRFFFLIDEMNVTDLMNMKWFFELTATEVCDNMEDADVIVTDKSIDVPAGKDLIREYDTEKILALMN